MEAAVKRTLVRERDKSQGRIDDARTLVQDLPRSLSRVRSVIGPSVRDSDPELQFSVFCALSEVVKRHPIATSLARDFLQGLRRDRASAGAMAANLLCVYATASAGHDSLVVVAKHGKFLQGRLLAVNALAGIIHRVTDPRKRAILGLLKELSGTDRSRRVRNLATFVANEIGGKSTSGRQTPLGAPPRLSRKSKE